MHEKQEEIRVKSADEKNVLLQDVLKSFTTEELDEELRKKMKNDLKEVYTEDFRHQYSFITGFLLQYINESTDETEMRLSRLKDNIDLYSDEFMEEFPDNNAYSKGVAKFIDHISLEIARLEYIKRQYGSALQSATALDTRIKSVKDQVEQANESLEKQKVDFIAILGIFSGIVLAFVGGITFSNSILQGIENISIYRLIAIAAMCGLVLVDAIGIAMRYVMRLTLREHKGWNHADTVLLVVNGLFIAILISVSIVYYMKFFHCSIV